VKNAVTDFGIYFTVWFHLLTEIPPTALNSGDASLNSERGLRGSADFAGPFFWGRSRLSMDEKSVGTPPKKCRQCAGWKKAKERNRTSKLLEKAIKAFEARFKSADFKPTVAEYLKLLQLEQESEHDSAKEIKVTWIDPTATSNSEK
jgi:hypothetical protein